MPDPELVLNRALEVLEDSTLTLRELTQQQYIELILNTLKTEENLSLGILERISALCIQIFKGDVRHSALGLNIIATILKRVQKPLPKLLPMAEAVADFIQASASLNKASGLQTIAFNTLMAFPDDVLVSLTYYEIIWEILNSFCHPSIVKNHPEEIQSQPFNIVSRLLRILDPQKKAAFVNEGLGVCFSTVIPCVVNVCKTHIITSPYVQTYLEVLEMLTEELIKIDYVDNAEWQTVLESIYSPHLYPSTMKSLLTSGCEHWHRLWIIFLKLLKTQITMNKAGIGSPINSMLPVVEMAFKMDVANRCRAFECWKHLIDNFSLETNEQFVNKRIRLLIIPLRSNNAKIEETALAKLDTWLHLIRQYQNRMDDRILYPFLEFCFGKHDPENVVIPGLISPKTKRISVKAFVELTGHINCSGCGLEPRLKNKLISANVLVNHWTEWVHCLKMAIRISAEKEVDLTTDTITCVWKSFVMTVAELPENNIRKDLFNELLTNIMHLAKEFPSAKMADIIINTLTPSLFDETIKPLLQVKEWQNGPLKQLVVLLIDPALFELYKNVYNKGLLKTLNLIMDLLANECPTSIDHYVEWLLIDLVPNDPTLHLWTALAESIQIVKPKCGTLICNFLLWPLKHMDMFTDMDCAAMVWYANYIVLSISLDKTALVSETTRILLEHERSSDITTYFKLCVLLALIKAKTQKQNYKLLNEEVKLLMTITSRINDYNEFKQAFPILIDTINLMLSFILPLDVTYLESIVSIIRLVLRVLNKNLKQDVCTQQITNISLEKTFENDTKLITVIKAIQPLFQNKEGIEFKVLIVDELLEFRSLCNKPVHDTIDLILNSIINHESIDSALREKIKKGIEQPQDSHENPERAVSEANSKTTKPVESELTTPVTKRKKKNETSIVNTVVENGEEFAVIKSNWKFNPRKLTENQKEKLQRKREDIPALYQDLSQSQDEFKLKSWKTDSQDASSTNSRSNSIPFAENVSVTLKNIPATNVVPKIIDNFFSESRKTNSGDTLDNEKTETTNSKDVGLTKLSPVVKTPRMALKDRVFRNVRNLIEKSTVPNEGNKNLNLLNETVSANVFNTPLSKCKDMKNIVHSAPSKISAERPARSKRKPKKFDDSGEYLKKRRNSSGQYESPSPENSNDFNDVSFPSQSLEHLSDKSVEKSDVVTELQSVEDHKIPASTESQPSIEVDSDAQPLSNQVVEVSSLAENDMVNKKDDKEHTDQQLDEVINCSVSDVSHDISVEEQTQSNNLKLNMSNDIKSTPKSISKKKGSDDVKSSAKKKSRIEKELAIDMVEGHPFLKFQSEKRVTRKCLANTPNGTRRKSLTEKLNKLKTDTKSVTKPKKDTSSKNISKDKSPDISKDLSITVCETQDLCPDATQDISEDIIESSQDSMATISVKSFKNSAKKSVSVEKVDKTIEETKNVIGNVTQDINTTADVLMTEENNDDTDFPANKTDIQDNVVVLTEEMDTEPTDEKNSSSGEVMVVNDEDIPVIEINTEDPLPGPDTLELANADTLPTELSQFDNNASSAIQICQNKDTSDYVHKEAIVDDQLSSVADDITITLSDITPNEETGNASSPSKDDDQRKKDFLDNTLEISPIKSLSPIVPKSPSPETSNDFLIVKLSDPVQINGEPMELSNSPEIFTEEKISPDKRDQSPPRVELVSSNSSPSSSLSLKKNRPQVRGGGRAAQMLGLCVPDRLHNIINKDKPEVDEPKKSSPVSTPARRNLRMLYNTAVDNENSDENEDIENFLKFKRTVPTADCSPSCPILKRKLADIADEATVSPANKRKRVSFHDPVFTSVSVQKYIESSGVRSPQNSALKRLERQIRNQTHMKSPKRLDHLFKLDTVLTKAIESFTDSDLTSNSDTQLSSLEPTPAVEVVKTSELNDTDPIFPDLVDNKDPINNVATELSSPGMSLLLVKELEGKIETVGDLAKLTELEINRLCIKAPKLQVVKKVLGDYASKKSEVTTMENVAKPCVETEAPAISSNVEVQTNVLTSETETQTSLVLQRLTSTQTDEVMTMQKVVQTDESGSKSTEDIIKSCLKDRKDFVSKLDEHLEEVSKRKLAEALPVIDCIDLLVKKMTSSDASVILNQVIKRESELHENGRGGNKELSFLLNHLCDKYSANDLILFCSQMLQNIHGKSV